jgi:abortive infection bacteriophage resistance protein
MTMDRPPPSAAIDQTYTQYTAALQAVMLDFQFIEEALRRYISRAYELIRQKTAGEIPFKFEEKDLERDSLGKLVQKFSQLSDNDVLCDTIRKLVPTRNMCAHNGLMITYQVAEAPARFDNLTAALERLRMTTNKCVLDLIAEGKKIGSS